MTQVWLKSSSVSGDPIKKPSTAKPVKRREMTLEKAPCFVWQFDDSGRCLWTNLRSRQLLDQDLDSFKDFGWKQVFQPEDARRLNSFLTDRDGPQMFQIEMRLKQSNSRVLLINGSRSQLESSQGFEHFVCAMDITHLDQTRSALIKTSRELEISNQELEHYAYIVSHDLQEPLRMVSGFCELLKEECSSNLDSLSKEYLTYILDGSKKMGTLIQGLLDYSRFSTQKFETEVCDLDRILSSVILSFESKIQETRATIERPEGLPSIESNSTFLTQTFQNLIDNALKYRHPDRPLHLKISYQIQDGCIEFLIEDNGQGVAPSHQGRVFKLFQRATTSSNGNGLGIGLAMVHKMIEQLGGSIALQSDGKSGSLFRLKLPYQRRNL
jgi:signal transduction histidine kinase